MEKSNMSKISVIFPSDHDYVPPVRKFIADILQVNDFNPKSAFRTEVIVDEICDNSINYGSVSVNAAIEIECDIYPDRVELMIKDEGGKSEDVKRLHSVMVENREENVPSPENKKRGGLGLEIVRMLAEDVQLEVDKNNLTSIRIIRKREN